MEILKALQKKILGVTGAFRQKFAQAPFVDQFFFSSFILSVEPFILSRGYWCFKSFQTPQNEKTKPQSTKTKRVFLSAVKPKKNCTLFRVNLLANLPLKQLPALSHAGRSQNQQTQKNE
jgi:hypothetical protein